VLGLDGSFRGRRDGRRFTVAPRSPELCGCEKNLYDYVNWVTIENSIARENRMRC
jgi:hypothetical protein